MISCQILSSPSCAQLFALDIQSTAGRRQDISNPQPQKKNLALKILLEYSLTESREARWSFEQLFVHEVIRLEIM